jgi:regulatory protein
MLSKNKVYTTSEALQKMQCFCVYQERSQEDVRRKLFELGFKNLEAEQIIAELIAENFLKEERFALAYVSGKFKIKKWGKLKIKAGLINHKIPSKLIDYAISKSIDEDLYREMIIDLIKKNGINIKKIKPAEKQKLINGLYAKGYDYESVEDAMKVMLT